MAKVQVIIEEIVKGAGNIDGVTKDLNTLDKTAQNSQRSTKTASMAFTEFNSALSLVKQGLQVVNSAYQATAGKTIEYANEVRKLSQVSGASAEDTSRLIQVLDDYKISADQALASTRFLTKNGHVATLETLGKLSDEYLKLNTQQEKNKFAQDNLGRGYAAYISILEKGSAAIKKQGDAVADNLILSQKVVDDARKQEIALDSLNDSWDGLTMTIGKVAIPIANDAANGFNVTIRALQLMNEENTKAGHMVLGLGEAMDKAGYQIWQEQQALIANKDAAQAAADGTDDLAESQKAAEDEAKSLTSIYQGLLSAMFSIQSANDSYAKTVDDLANKDVELKNKKDQLTLAMWQEQQAGKLTNEENLRYIQQIAEVTQAQEENQKAKEKANEDVKKASDQRVYDLAQQKLAADGVVSSGEYEYLQNLAVSMGLVTRASADQAITESKRADALVSSFEQTLPPMERSLQVMQAIAAYNGQTVNFGVNFSGNLPGLSSYAPGISSGGASTAGSGNRKGRSRDSGGSGVAGTPYMIGTGAQPEMFVPNSNGTFIPNANKMGATYNIVINNPKKETAENSIRSALKKLSFTGVAA